MDLKKSLLSILEESNLIEKFEYWNRIEDDLRSEPTEQAFKYRVNAQNKWRIHSLELLKRNSKYKDGSIYKFRV